MGKWIGIDLGTTNSVAAICDGAHPRILDNMEAKSSTPSVVGFRQRRGRDGQDRTEILVGEPAVDNRPLKPSETVVSIKRLMGRGLADPEVERVRRWAEYKIVAPSSGTADSLRILLGGKELSPTDISAMILKKVKEDAEFRLGAHEEVTHAVVTVPAYFSQIQRDATRKACLKAGMKVIKLLEEPTAAAIAFGMDDDTTVPKLIVVYDLGGGTFDISVLMMAGGVFAPLKLQGDMWLGGDDFDQVIVDEVVAWVKTEYGIDPLSAPRFMVELKRTSQRVKERLSGARSADLIVTGLLEDRDRNLIDVQMEFTREWFESKIQPLVDRTMGLMKLAIDKANQTIEEIDYVLVAGNSTSVPLVQHTLEQVFGAERIVRGVHPKHCVAMGAALVAARIGGRIVCQARSPSRPDQECGHVNNADDTACARCGAALDLEDDQLVVGAAAPFSYGAQSAGDQYTIFIEDGEPYPTINPRAHDFHTRTPDQRMISIPVYGGDIMDRASANEKQGEAFAILPLGLPQGASVRVKLWLDEHGVFQLSAHLQDGTDLHPWSVTKGEMLDLAIKGLETVEEALGQKDGVVSPGEKQRVEQAREAVFNKMRNGEWREALDEVSHLGRIVEEAGETQEYAERRALADGLMGYTQYILSVYGWALAPDQVRKLEEALREVQQDLAAGQDAAFATAVQRLDQFTDEIPEVLRLLLGIEIAIRSRVAPADPLRAREFERELAETVAALKSRDTAVGAKLSNLSDRLGAVITEIEERQSAGRRRLCSLGHEVGPGVRWCPRCNEDMWGLQAKVAGGRSGDLPRLGR